MPIIDYETCFDPSNETARSYATGYKPYMLINGMDHWDLDVLGNRDVMIEHFKDSRVDYYPHNMREEDVRPYFNDLASAIGNFDNPTGLFDRIDASERTAYIQWNMKDNEWKKMKELGGFDVGLWLWLWLWSWLSGYGYLVMVIWLWLSGYGYPHIIPPTTPLTTPTTHAPLNKP